MNRFSACLTYLVATVVLFAIGTVIIPHQPAAASAAAPLEVQNTPLPVKGAVSAAQSGPWTVGINGTPNVNVSSLPAVHLSSGVLISGGSVSVSNEPGQVLDVFDANSRNWLTQRHYESLCIVSGTYTCSYPASVIGPPDKLWVIDQISGRCASSADSQVFAVSIDVMDANGGFSTDIPLSFPVAGDPRDGFFFERTRIVVTYRSPGNDTLVSLHAIGTGTDIYCTADLVGYYTP
jgi:hypothetical protein